MRSLYAHPTKLLHELHELHKPHTKDFVRNKKNIRLEKRPPKQPTTAYIHDLHLWRQPGSYPLSKRPSRRRIIQTIEAYRYSVSYYKGSDRRQQGSIGIRPHRGNDGGYPHKHYYSKVSFVSKSHETRGLGWHLSARTTPASPSFTMAKSRTGSSNSVNSPNKPVSASSAPHHQGPELKKAQSKHSLWPSKLTLRPSRYKIFNPDVMSPWRGNAFAQMSSLSTASTAPLDPSAHAQEPERCAKAAENASKNLNLEDNEKEDKVSIHNGEISPKTTPMRRDDATTTVMAHPSNNTTRNHPAKPPWHAPLWTRSTSTRPVTPSLPSSDDEKGVYAYCGGASRSGNSERRNRRDTQSTDAYAASPINYRKNERDGHQANEHHHYHHHRQYLSSRPSTRGSLEQCRNINSTSPGLSTNSSRTEAALVQQLQDKIVFLERQNKMLHAALSAVLEMGGTYDVGLSRNATFAHPSTMDGASGDMFSLNGY
ncbi:hypothetical protein DIZ76_016686 [Coccidioides immitis]|nr:hypothetical protein DIZ76_016686 [Coccidioides immitis]